MKYNNLLNNYKFVFFVIHFIFDEIQQVTQNVLYKKFILLFQVIF